MEDKKEVKEKLTKEELTKEELKIIINLLSQISVRITEAPAVIQLINKVSRIIDDKKVSSK